MMNTFNFCWTALAVESERTGVFLNTDNCFVNNNSEEEFDKPIKRVSYLYKYGSFNINFFSHCFSIFIAEVPDSLKIIDKICLIKNLNICSISTGPGTYIIGFLYALQLLGKPLKGSVNYKFINKHVTWRNMVCEMFGLVPLNAPKLLSCKLIQCDVLTEINPKAQSYIKIADVLFLCHTFSSIRDTDVINHVSKDILQLLKPEALVFFMFNEDNSSNLKELSTFGRFLYGPTEITLKDMAYDKTIPTVLQVPVVNSGSSFFGVWQKFDSISHQEQSSTVELLAATLVSESPEPLNDINIIKSDTAQSICKLKDSFKMSTSDAMKITEAISSEDVSISTESSASLKSGSTEPKLICNNAANFVKVSGTTKNISELEDKTIPTVLQGPVVDSGSSFFGIWQKDNSMSHQEQSSTVKLVAVRPVVSPEPLSDINIIKSDSSQSISKLKDSLKLSSTSTSDSKLTEVISSKNVSISTGSGASFKSEPKLFSSNTTNVVKKVSGGIKTTSELKDFKIANTPTSNPKATGAISSEYIFLSNKRDDSRHSTETKVSCSNQANFIKKNSLSTTTHSVITAQKNEPSKSNLTNPESTLNSLVKTLDRLVTNLEEFVNSQSSVRNPHNQQCCFTCSCHTRNMHQAESWNTRQNFNSCVRNRCCSPRVENYHICPNTSNYCSCSMPYQDNFCQNVRSPTPHIVIPLQNTTETTLAQVFSLVSQVNNSSI